MWENKLEESFASVDFQSEEVFTWSLSVNQVKKSVQFLSKFSVCFTSTETIRTIRDGEPRTSTSTFTQFLSSVTETALCRALVTETAIGLCLFLDGERPLFYQHCNVRDVRKSKLIGHRSGSKLTVQVQSSRHQTADVSDPVTRAHLRFSQSPLRRLCWVTHHDGSWCVNPNPLELFVVFGSTRDGVSPYKCSFSH